jgi:hypothetical protein
MSLTDGPAGVTAGDLLNLQAGIQAFTNSAEATSEAALIQAGKDTTAAYAARLEAANTGQSEVVMATVSLMEGGTPLAGKLVTPTSPTANEFQHLIISYLPAQQAFAVANGLNITIYNAEVVGLGIGAGGDGTQNNFLKNFGSAALTLSQFESTLSGLTNVTVAAIDAQYQFFVKLYGAAPANLPAGYPNADAAARAVTFGFAIGTDFANPTLAPTIISQTQNAKVLNAQTINGDVAGASGYQPGVALGLQPTALPLQGSTAPPPNVFNFTPTVDTFTTSLANATFNALPTVQSGLAVNTLNVGDSAVDTAGDGTLNLTTAPQTTGANPAFATGVTLTGISTANINGQSGAPLTGFSGTITGLKVANILAGDIDAIQLGIPNNGLKTLLTNININGYAGPADDAFTAIIAAGAADLTKTISIGITGNLGTTVADGAAELAISNDLGGGTAASPNNTYGTWAITAANTANLQLEQSFSEGGVGGATGLNLAGAGVIAVGQATAGNWQLLTKIDSSKATNTVFLTGATSGAASQARASTANPGWLFGSDAGLLNDPGGSFAVTSVLLGAGLTFLDVSSASAAQVAALTTGPGAGVTVNTGNEIIVSDAVATTTSTATFANIKGFATLGIAGPGGTVNMANLPATITNLEYITAASGALTVTNAPTKMAINTFDNAVGTTIAVGNPTGLADSIQIAIGNTFHAPGAGVIGSVTLTGEENVTLLSVGNAGDTNVIGAGATGVGLLLTPTLGGAEHVSITGATPLAMGFEFGAIADVTAGGALIANNLTITDTNTAFVRFAAAFDAAVTPLKFVPAGNSTQIFFSTNAVVIDASNSGGLGMDGGDANVGDTITGSTTAGNFLGGSIGSDAITANNNAANTIYTNGGGDAILLGAAHPANQIGIYVGFPTVSTPGTVELVQNQGITENNDFAQAGWWGLLTTEAGYNATGTTYAGLAAQTGTSASATTIINFLATDRIDLSSGINFGGGVGQAWGSGGNNGVTGGTHIALGLVNADISAVGVGTQSAQAVIGHGLPNDTVNTLLATTNIIELTGQQFSGPTDVATYLGATATNIALAFPLGNSNSAHMIAVYSDFIDGMTHVADVALVKTGAPTVNLSAITEHVSDLAIVGTPLLQTATTIQFVV